MVVLFKPSIENHDTNPINFEWVAKLCHELNRQLAQAFGDISHKSWDESEEWVRESTRKGVAFHILHPEATPRESHGRWMEHKEREGWSCGPDKDDTAKTHPCMVPYDELPTEHRMKDHLFRNAVKSVLDALNEQGVTISAECGCDNFSEQSYI